MRRGTTFTDDRHLHSSPFVVLLPQPIRVQALLNDILIDCERDSELFAKYGSIDVQSAQQISLEATNDVDLNAPQLNIPNLPHLDQSSNELPDESIAAQVRLFAIAPDCFKIKNF
jgi:hypothetical protein